MRIIDADSHVLEWEIPWRDLLPEPYKARAPLFLQDAGAGRRGLLIDGRIVPTPAGRACGMTRAVQLPATYVRTTGRSDPAQRLKDLDAEGIECAVQFGSIPFLSVHFLYDKDLAGAIATVYNDWLGDFCSKDPARLKGIALIPLQDPAQAAAELRRAVLKHKFVGVAVGTHSSLGKNIDHRDYDPVFAEAERLGVAVCVHAGAGDGVPAGTDRFDNAFYTHAIAHPFEQMIGSMCLVVGGVLDRFPRLRVGFMEAGVGWVAYWAHRLDEHYELLGSAVPWLTKPPSEYLRSERVFYAFEPEDPLVAHACATMGADRFLFSTDYGHPEAKFPNTVKMMNERSDIPKEVFPKIMGENAARFYGI
jgi:uncharacterized protein